MLTTILRSSFTYQALLFYIPAHCIAMFLVDANVTKLLRWLYDITCINTTTPNTNLRTLIYKANITNSYTISQTIFVMKCSLGIGTDIFNLWEKHQVIPWNLLSLLHFIIIVDAWLHGLRKKKKKNEIDLLWRLI